MGTILERLPCKVRGDRLWFPASMMASALTYSKAQSGAAWARRRWDRAGCIGVVAGLAHLNLGLSAGQVLKPDLGAALRAFLRR
jgi:hypothetical protein